jgi:pimeloyl-ACP methyl ester carboxylesterase
VPIVELNGVDLYYETVGAGDRLVLTHGSWSDGTSWTPALTLLTPRFEVVTWDRRGHSRSQDGPGPGSRDEDAADLAALIEHLGGAPVHLAGNSYGSIVVLTLLGTRPDLAASTVVHEPPLLGLLDGTTDPAITDALAHVEQEIGTVLALIDAGEHRAAAGRFIDHVASGVGSWAQLPEPLRAALAGNAATFLDEERDPTSRSINATALAATTVPLMLTHGTDSPTWYRAIIAELKRLVPAARVEVITGAGHIPHATHPEHWVGTLLAFHEVITPGGSRRDE